MTQIQKFTDVNDLKKVFALQYQKQINNYFGDDKRALRFLSGVVSAVQRNPDLLNCTPVSVVNSFMTMAQLQLMPSDVSGEAYVIPYKNNGVKEAQFQLGYQGLVTLFYRASVKSITAEIVYKNDTFAYRNGVVDHQPDVFSDDRGEAIGAYAIVQLNTGGVVSKVMSKKEIVLIGKRFSKSFAGKFTPWDEKNDPQLWMWRKTVLKQIAKLVPKNDAITTAIAVDNQDSTISDKRIEDVIDTQDQLKMGSILKSKTNDKKTTEKEELTEEDKKQIEASESSENNQEAKK
jgi:recombination protein RecT